MHKWIPVLLAELFLAACTESPRESIEQNAVEVVESYPKYESVTSDSIAWRGGKFKQTLRFKNDKVLPVTAVMKRYLSGEEVRRLRFETGEETSIEIDKSFERGAYLVEFYDTTGIVFRGRFIWKGSISDKSSQEHFDAPIIIDTIAASELRLSPSSMLNAWYRAEAIGSINDILDLSYGDTSLSKNYYRDSFWIPDIDSDQSETIDNAGLKLIVDTTSELYIVKSPIWARDLFPHYFTNDDLVLEDDTTFSTVKSYPIFLVNSGENAALIETQDNSLIMTLEAFTEDQQWKSVEYWSHSWCGNSYFHYKIPANHYLFTRGIWYGGDVHTIGRLKLMNGRDSLYSNVFSISVCEGQFIKPDLENMFE